jgi:hypothetical protein
MSRVGFYFGKAKMLIAFTWWREWQLVKDEWNLTYAQYKDAESRIEEISREAVARLLRKV